MVKDDERGNAPLCPWCGAGLVLRQVVAETLTFPVLVPISMECSSADCEYSISLAPQPASAEHAARRERARDALRAQGAEGLLLRLYRVLRHLLPDGCVMPTTLDQHDKETLTMVSLHLRDTIGRENVKAFLAGTLEDAP